MDPRLPAFLVVLALVATTAWALAFDAGAEAPEAIPSRLGDESANAGAGAGDDASAALLEQIGCVAAHGDYPVSMESAQDRLPPGFRARAFPGTGDAFATFVLRSCEASRVDGFEMRGSVDAMLLLSVLPPEEHRAEHVESYFVPVATRANDLTVASALAQWRLGVVRVAKDIEVTRQSSAEGFVLRASSPQEEFSFELAAVSGGFEYGAFTQRLFGLTNGTVTDVVEVTRSPHRAAPFGSSALRFETDDHPFPERFAGWGRVDHWPASAESYRWVRVGPT